MADIGSTDIDLSVKKCTTRALATSIGLPLKNKIGLIKAVIGARTASVEVVRVLAVAVFRKTGKISG